MTSAVGSWTQSGHRLQANPENSGQQSLGTSPPEEAISTYEDQKLESNPVYRGPVPWYRAVTNEHVSVRPTTLQHETNGNTSSFHPIDDLRSTDDSSTAVSVSQRSASPSTNQEHASPTEDLKDIYSTVQIPSVEIDTRLHTHWSDSHYPVQPPLEASGEQELPISPEAGSRYSLPRTPTFETSEAKTEVKRKLRRTPRSRTIRQRAANPEEPYRPSTATDRSSSAESARSQPEKQSPPISLSAPSTNPWRKRTYPLQLSTLTPIAPEDTPPLDGEFESASEFQQDVHPSSNVSWRRRAYPLHPSTGVSSALPISPPSTNTKVAPNTKMEDQTRETPSTTNATASPTANTIKTPSASMIAPTPNNTVTLPSVITVTSPSAKVATPPSTDTVASPSINATIPLSANTETSLSAKPVTNPSTDVQMAEQTKVIPHQTQENNKPDSAKNLWQRRQYPLQSPASKIDLRNSLTPPPSPKHDAGNTDNTTERKRDDAQNALHTQTAHHPSYPLQLPVQTPTVRAPLPPISTQAEHRHQPRRAFTDQPSRNTNSVQIREEWRREPYPLQSPKNIPPIYRFPSPQPPIEDQKNWKPDQIHLPKNIRAVKDSEEHDDRQGRTIIICLDGTGDKFDNDNSNIVHLISALKKDDPHQVTYYQAGIGTYNKGGLSWGFSAAADMAVGSGLGLHVRDAYHFLMHSYKEGDRICIFGFSRGAYTARCLAGMIHKVGLLPPRNIQQIEFAYEFYAKDTAEGWQQSDDFKRTFCIDVNVYFLGCFDSVASVGFIPRQLPLSTTPNNKPRYFRHAMALDERRAKFKICRHQSKHWKDIEKPNSSVHKTARSVGSHIAHYLQTAKDQDDTPPPSYSEHARYGILHHPNVTDEEYERLTGHEAPFETDVDEVWFAGCHADVGGGAVANEERHKLAQIPLRWMIRQTFECNTGIIFKAKVLAEFGLDVHTLWPKYERLSVPTHGPPPSYLEKFDTCLPPRSVRRDKLIPINKYEKGEHFYHLKSPVDEDWTPEQVEDFYDAMSPIHDQLLEAPGWWILEVWPVEYKVPTAPGVVLKRTGMNLGRYRGVDDSEPKVHWTVMQRMQHQGYKIRARTAAHTAWRAVS